MRRPWAGIDPALALAVGLALLALAPLLGRGFVLTYDMVFVPSPPLTAELLGLGSGVPRAVPSDALVALAARVLPAQVVQSLILLGVFILGGWGAARLLPSERPAARAAAAVFFVWNAYVYERLLLGHWTLLVSYAALPWVVRAALDLRSDPGTWPRLVLALAAATAGSASGGLVASATALAVVITGPRPRAAAAALVAGPGIVLALPWLLPILLRPGGLPARPEGVEAFAARADSALGVLGSLLTLGGAWNARIAPPGRGGLLAVPALLLLLGAALAGLPELRRRMGAGLLVAAAAALPIAAAGALPLLSDALRALVEVVPGAGLLRDGQRYLAPLALAQALGFGMTVERLPRPPALAALAVAAPVLTLPVLGLGAGGRLQPVGYPGSYGQVREVLAEDPEPGSVLVLPWSAYVAPAWNGGRPVLDPATRWFDRRTLASDDLIVGGSVLPGEDPATARAAALLRDEGPTGAALAALGVRYVLLNELGGWREQAERLEGLDRLELVLDTPELRLYRGPPSASVPVPAPPTVPVVAGDALALALVVAASARLVGSGRMRAKESRWTARSA